jgi:hypothetical protein
MAGSIFFLIFVRCFSVLLNDVALKRLYEIAYQASHLPSEIPHLSFGGRQFCNDRCRVEVLRIPQPACNDADST